MIPQKGEHELAVSKEDGKQDFLYWKKDTFAYNHITAPENVELTLAVTEHDGGQEASQRIYEFALTLPAA